jgi:hypothetical protein
VEELEKTWNRVSEEPNGEITGDCPLSRRGDEAEGFSILFCGGYSHELPVSLRGAVETGGNVVYVFQITPRRKRAGLIRGQILIDSLTGIAVHQAGRFVKRPSVLIRRMEVTRDTHLRDGVPDNRVTHVAVETRLVGRTVIDDQRAAVAEGGSPNGTASVNSRGLAVNRLTEECGGPHFLDKKDPLP